MARIRIIAIPPGDAPESFRSAWVGVEMETVSPSQGIAIGLNGGEPQNGDGHEVIAGVAIAALLDKNEPAADAAAKWFMVNPLITTESRFVFSRNVCQEL